MRKRLMFFICAAACLAPAGPARSADAGFCNGYVEKALAASQTVRQLACGYDLGHPQWSTDPNVHRRWCLESRQSSVEMEGRYRDKYVNECAQCRNYANAAAAAAAENIKLQCGFTGARWANDAAGHFNWCMGLDPKDGGFLGLYPTSLPKDPQLASETDARNSELNKCREAHANQNPVAPTMPAVNPIKAAKDRPKASTRLPKSLTNSDQAIARTKPSASTKRNAVSASPRGVVTKKSPCKPGQPDDPCRLRSKMVAPGLLEGDSGLGAQGPAGAGRAGGAAGGSGAAVLRSGGSNVAAPPAGGGLR